MVSVFFPLIILFGGNGFSGNYPPAAPDHFFAQIAPPEVDFYVAWAAGTTPDPNSEHLTEKLLLDPEVEELSPWARQFLPQFMGIQPGRGDAELLDRIFTISSQSGVLYATKITPRGNDFPLIEGAAVVHLPDAELADWFLERIEATFATGRTKVAAIEVNDVALRSVPKTSSHPRLSWGKYKDYVMLFAGEEEPQRCLDRIGNDPPEWLVDAWDATALDRPAQIHFLKPAVIFELFAAANGSGDAIELAKALGIKSVASVAWATGFDETSCRTKGRLQYQDDGPSGLFELVSAASLTSDELRIVPSDAAVAVNFKLNLPDLVTFLKRTTGRRDIEQALRGASTQLGFNVEEDLLPTIGETWRIWTEPGSMSVVNGWSFAISLQDAEKFAQFHEQALLVFKEEVGDRFNVRKRTVNDTTVYEIPLPGVGIPVTVNWCIHNEELLVTAIPLSMDAILEQASDRESLASLPEIASRLVSEGDLYKLVRIDMQVIAKQAAPFLGALGLGRQGELGGIQAELGGIFGAFPPLAPLMSHMTPVVISASRLPSGVSFEMKSNIPGLGSLPTNIIFGGAVASGAETRRAAQRTQSMNNLRAIVLGLLNFESAKGALPAGYHADDQGKPLLSWRVHILPFMGQEEQALYAEFNLDEPWDSENNKKLIERMPDTYRHPSREAPQGHTVYLGVSGKDGLFIRPANGDPRPLGTPLRRVTDGMSKTISVVEVPDASAVPWTRPADFAPNEKDPFERLVGELAEGFLAARCDGSVFFVPKTTDPDTLRAMFTKSGGETIAIE